MENVIILGSGPAGLTAGLYAARAGLKPVVLEGLESGGQLMQTNRVANYPGFPEPLSGPALIAAMRTQAEKAGVVFVTDVVESVDFSARGESSTDAPLRLFTMMGETREARAVILATGAGVTRTNLPGEAKYWGRGISACLTCDGAFYAGKRVTVVGEGPATLAAKTYLERCGAEVVALLSAAEVASFEGDGKRLTAVTLNSRIRHTDTSTIHTDGLFLVTARTPQTAFLGSAVARDEAGYIRVEEAETSVPGVFAAGDCSRPRNKQAIIAAGDGALAALAAQRYLSRTSGLMRS